MKGACYEKLKSLRDSWRGWYKIGGEVVLPLTLTIKVS